MASFPTSSTLLSFIIIISLLLGMRVSAQLSTTYYNISCPDVLSIIQTEVNKAVENESRMAASLLRLHFHDCFVKGCDGSVLLDDNVTSGFVGEKTAIPNLNSLRGFEVIDTIKKKLEEACTGKVSCADILAVAARDSVVKLGGPSWSVPLGRRDSTNASFISANSDLPSPSSSLDNLISAFLNKNFTAKEMVVLSGAHTVGEAQCTSYRTRIYTETNMDSDYRKWLKSTCPLVGEDSNLAPLDNTTQNVFDNAYYKNLGTMKGLLHSDQVLYDVNASTNSTVELYRDSLETFFTDFGNAMIKMGNLSPLTGSDGEIRTNRRKKN